MKPATFKRCKCRDADARELGAKCPKLRRKDGSWNPNHGTWYGKAEVPAGPDGKRISLRLGGFANESDLLTCYQAAEKLLSIPDAGLEGHEARMEILAMIKAAHRKSAPWPEYEELHRKYRAGQPLQAITFGEFWTQWMERRRRLGDVRKTTLRGYESHYRVHLRGVLENVRMDRLFLPVVEQVFVRIDERNAEIAAARESPDPAVRASVRGERITGPTTKQRIKATLRSVLADAQRQKLVSDNVARLIKLEGAKSANAIVWTAQRVAVFQEKYAQRLAEVRERPGGRKVSAVRVWESKDLRPSPVMVWTPVQLGAFLDHAHEHRLYALFHLIAFRGLRRGEACGVRWVDLDTQERTLAVAKQLVQVGWDFEEGDPKTAASDGVVALDTGTVSVLREHRKRQLEEKLAWGSSWTDTGRIFTREDGTELHPGWVSELFSQLAFQAGVPPIRLHDLRHCAATLAYAAGGDTKKVSAMLRHSSTSITENTYTSVLPELAHEMAEASAALVPRAAAGGASRTAGLPSVSPESGGGPTDSGSVVKPLVR